MSNQASLGDISDNSGSSNQKSSENELERRTVCGVPPEDWKSERLENITEIVSGKSLPTEEQGESEGFPVYKVEDMNKSENFKYMNSADNYLTKEKIDELNHSLHPESTVILPKVGAALLTNKRRILTEKASFDNNTMGWIPRKELNPEFFYYTTCRVDMESYAQKGAVPSISKSIAGNLKFPVPEKDEQRRIASVLYNVDQAISKTEEIIEQTQRVKKGLMQDLFTEGYYSHEEFEEHPLLGERPPSWSVETVGDLTKKIQYGLSEALQEEGEYPIFRMNNYENGYMRDHPMKYIDLSEEEFQKYKVEKGDILFNRTNSHELVGKTGIFELEDDYVFASYLVRLRTNEKVDPYYLNFFMNSEEGQNRLKTFATKGVSQSNINASSVQKLKVPVPDKKEEQKKIIEVIKNLDKKIEWNKEYLEDLKSLKKGLMQDLLTGSIRTDEDVRVLDEVVEVED